MKPEKKRGRQRKRRDRRREGEVEKERGEMTWKKKPEKRGRGRERGRTGVRDLLAHAIMYTNYSAIKHQVPLCGGYLLVVIIHDKSAADSQIFCGVRLMYMCEINLTRPPYAT